MSEHRYAYLMILYAQDALETDRPWQRYQWQRTDGRWNDCLTTPEWESSRPIRRKPAEDV